MRKIALASVSVFSALSMAAVMSPATAADLATTGTVTNTSADTSAVSQSRTLSVTPEVQQYHNWCWAAGGTAIAKYKGARRATQNEFCLAGRGLNVRLCPDEPAQLYNVQRGLQHYGVSAGRTTGVLSFAEVQRNIDNDAPIPVGYYWSAGGGHLVTIIGYNARNSTLTVIDSYPSHQRRQTHTYNSFVRNNNWRWAQSITGIGGRADNGRPADSPTKTPVETPANVMDPSSAHEVTVSDDAMQAVELAQNAKSLAQVDDLATDSATRSDSATATAGNEAFAVNTLNPEFVTGASENPAIADGHAVKATTSTGEAATMLFKRVDGELQLTSTVSGDEAAAYGAMADGGTVFQEPQTNSWFRMADGRVEALNDAGRTVLNGDSASLADYQASVKDRFADKMEGSDYQNGGFFGGIKN